MKRNLFYYLLLFVIFCAGAFFRLKLFFLNQGLQCDEANLALNITKFGYLELFSPLQRLQVAPPLFLVISKFIYNALIFHNTAYFSDLLLRVVPLLSGLIAIPAFGCLLNTLFKNKMINALGMTLLAINQPAISYSCIFKQYSTELLITVLLVTAFLKIDLSKKTAKSYVLFFITGLAPYISLSSLIILPCGFLYLLIKAAEEKQIKNCLWGMFISFCAIFSFIVLLLVPVYKTHYAGMADFWTYSFQATKSFNEYMINFNQETFRTYKAMRTLFCLFIISNLFILIKRPKLLTFTLFPFIITFLLTVHKLYPFDERFLLFLMPLLFTAFLYPVVFVPPKTASHPVYLLVIFILVFNLIKMPPVEYLIRKQEAGREIWEYLYLNYDKKSPVFFGDSVNTNNYYSRFYRDKINAAGSLSGSETGFLQEQGIKTFYYIKTRSNRQKFIVKPLENFKIIEQKKFQSRAFWGYSIGKNGCLIKFIVLP